MTVRDNIGLLALPRVAELGVVRRGRELALVRPEMDRLAIKAPSPETPVWTLSGGNQQKVLVARSLLSEPKVLLADEPTRGVDAGARVELYRILRDAAASGRSVVVTSSDAIELGGLCDRVLVFSRGQIVRTLAGDEISEEIGRSPAPPSPPTRSGMRPMSAHGDACGSAGSRPVTMPRASSSRSLSSSSPRTPAS